MTYEEMINKTLKTILVFVIIFAFYFVFYTIFNVESGKHIFLHILSKDEANESYGWKGLKEVLKNGGEINITLKHIMDYIYTKGDIEKYYKIKAYEYVNKIESSFDNPTQNGNTNTDYVDSLGRAEFEKKYAISGPDDRYYIRGAIVNFMRDKGWIYVNSVSLGEMVLEFRKASLWERWFGF